MYYILERDDRSEPTGVRKVDDVREWAEAYRDVDRSIKQERVGLFDVSTVFLGIDHNWSGGPPVLFETMVFQSWDRNDVFSERYCTVEQAQEGHRRAVRETEQRQVGAQVFPLLFKHVWAVVRGWWRFFMKMAGR